MSRESSLALFPIQIWKKKRGVSYLPTDRNYDLYRYALQSNRRSSLFFPNFVNLDANLLQPARAAEDDPERYKYEVATMGCRTRVFENRFVKRPLSVGALLVYHRQSSGNGLP